MLRQWKINWNIALNNDSPVYKQIEKNIIIEISKGRLASGTPMPGSRELASHLKVNRNTVAKAYEQLVVKGWLQVKGKRGTFVADPLPVAITTNGNGHTKEQKAAFSFNIFGVEQLPFTITETNWQVRFDDGLPTNGYLIGRCGKRRWSFRTQMSIGRCRNCLPICSTKVGVLV